MIVYYYFVSKDGDLKQNCKLKHFYKFLETHSAMQVIRNFHEKFKKMGWKDMVKLWLSTCIAYSMYICKLSHQYTNSSSFINLLIIHQFDQSFIQRGNFAHFTIF